MHILLLIAAAYLSLLAFGAAWFMAAHWLERRRRIATGGREWLEDVVRDLAARRELAVAQPAPVLAPEPEPVTA